MSLGLHTLVISYDTDPTIHGALYCQSHTCFNITLSIQIVVKKCTLKVYIHSPYSGEKVFFSNSIIIMFNT